MKKTILTYIVSVTLVSLCLTLLWACESWELPGLKTQRICDKPAGVLNAQIQQRQVNFTIASNTGTIDQVKWDFGNGSTTVTSGMTVTYTYPASNTYTVAATLGNTCGNETILLRTISVSEAVVPTVTLQAPTDVSTTAMTLRLSVTAAGNAGITRYGVCYSTTNMTPGLGDSVSDKMESLAINTTASFSLTNLQPNTTYYVRSFATNSAGSGYSAVQTIRTGLNPSVAINGPAIPGTTTATVNFIVTNAGSPAVTEYGICYSSTTNTPDVSNATVAPVTNPAVGSNVVVTLTNLTPNLRYYYRPFAKSASGVITYGATVESFMTVVDTVSPNLVASVSFTDKSLLDDSGFNNHVIPVNGPSFTTDRKGKANSALLLDGQSNYVYMAENNSLRPDALSISLWMKPVVVNGRMQIYNKSRFTDSAYEMYSALIKPNETGAGVTINTDIKQNSNCQPGGWLTFPLTSNIPLNTWHHLVFTYTGRTVRMYFDNALLYSVDNLPASAMDKCPGGELKFGAGIQSLPQYFNGALDDIRIYSRALTASEVQTLFNQ